MKTARETPRNLLEGSEPSVRVFWWVEPVWKLLETVNGRGQRVGASRSWG